MAEDPSVVYFPCCRIETVPRSGMYMHACFTILWAKSSGASVHSVTCLSLFTDLPTSDVTNSVSDLGAGVLLSFQSENFLGFVCECVVWVCGCVGVCKLAHPPLSKCVFCHLSNTVNQEN